MMKPRLAAVAIAALLAGLTACSGSYQNSIQGSYGSSYSRGTEALRAKDYERAADQYAFAAGSGHPKALIAYGRLFARGTGVEQDPARAAALFEEAYGKTSSSRSRAALELGLVLLEGGEGPSGTLAKDEARAEDLLIEALEAGETRAAGRLGRIYDRGLGVEPDPAQAIAYYRRAAPNDVSSARRLAALLAESGASENDVARIAERVIAQLETRAQGGDQKAWAQLADIFSKDRIVDPDPARAIGYLQNLPNDNDPAMNLRLARLYEQAGDRQERKKHLRLAADAGDAKAQTALARLFLKPGTADTNGAVGRYYAERAIGQNSTSAMVYLGVALMRGDVLDKEPLLGETLLRRASQNGHVGATAALGRAILSGDIRGRSPEEGKELLEAAASEGSSSAMNALAFGYQRGRGLPQNEALSLYWMEKAANSGNERARKFLSERQGV